jgi:hypothetical protein
VRRFNLVNSYFKPSSAGSHLTEVFEAADIAKVSTQYKTIA